MKQPHGLEVKLLDASLSSTKAIKEYKNPHGGNDARLGGLLRSQVIAAQPGKQFTLQIVVDQEFVKFSAQGVRVVIVARDCSSRGLSSSNTVTYWWISMRDKTLEMEYFIHNSRYGGKGLVIPEPADPAKGNPDWHRHPTAYRADSGCIAVYIERGKLLNMKPPSPNSPPIAIQSLDFRALTNDNGQPYIFEFRNRGLSEALELQVSPPSTFEYDSDNYVIPDRDIKKYIAKDEDAMDIDDEESVLDDVFSSSDSSSGSNDVIDSDDEEEESEEESEQEIDEEDEVQESQRIGGAKRGTSAANEKRYGMRNASQTHLTRPERTAPSKPVKKVSRPSGTANNGRTRGEQEHSLNAGTRKKDSQLQAEKLKAKQAYYASCAGDNDDSDADDEEPLSAQDIEMYRSKQEKPKLNRSSHSHIPQATINQQILKDSPHSTKVARSRCSNSDRESQDADDEIELIELEIKRNMLEIKNNLLKKQHIELSRRQRQDTNRIRSVKDGRSGRL